MRAPTVHLVRHGESTWHLDGRVQGQYAGPGEPVLTTKGEEQARAAGRLLAARLDKPASARVVASDLARAVASARLVAQELGLDPSAVWLEPAWREQHLGTMEASRAADLAPEPAPDGVDISEVAWGGGESMRQVHTRVAAWLTGGRGAPGVQEPGELVVVSHEHTIRAALAVLRGRTWREVDWDEPIPPGAVLSTRRRSR